MNSQTPSANSLLAQADLIFVLADLLGPPAQARPRLAELNRDDLRTLIEATALPEQPVVLQALQAAWEAAQSLSDEDWSDEYHRLFEGAMLCPLNETAYIRRDKGAILGDLAGYYRAFGWAPAAQSGEKPDHLLSELQFLALLLTMQAQATPEAAALTAEAMASFAADHLNDWIGTVAQQLQACTSLPFYHGVETALRETWRALLAAHRWPVTDPTAEPFTATEADAEPFCQCGATAKPAL